FLSTPSFMPGSVGAIGSTTPFQPRVGSDDSDTARYPTDSFFSSAMTANQRPESGSYSRRGSLSTGRSNFGLAALLTSAWVICRTTLPVLLSWTTTLALVKLTTWSGPTAPELSGQSFGPGPDAPGNAARISVASPYAGADARSDASTASLESV